MATNRIAEDLQSPRRGTCQHDQLSRELGDDGVQHHGGSRATAAAR